MRVTHGRPRLRQNYAQALIFEWRFDVTGAPLEAAPGDSVSVVLAVRHGEHILSGELHIPRERWDMTLLLRTLEPGIGRPS
jgi:hypothetical protein